MAVRRMVCNITTPEPGRAAAFYRDMLDLQLVMDHGWIITYASEAETKPEISFASEGGSGTAVPDLSIEVDNFEDVHDRVTRAGHPILYGPTDEPWGVRRFFVRDPFGRVLNILTHAKSTS